MMLAANRATLAGPALPGLGPATWTPARLDGTAVWAKAYPIPLDPQAAALWLNNELAATAAVQHPAVLRPYGLWPGPDGTLHLLFERGNGRRWDEIVRVGQQRHGYLAARGWDAVTQAVVHEVGRAMEQGHFVGVAHAALAPDSVWVELTGPGDLVVRLTDFARSAPILAGPRIRFAAPEQLDNAPTDARTDVFRLAMLVYFSLTGTTPWAEEDPLAARVARNVAPDHLRDDKSLAAWSLVARWPTVAGAVKAALEVDPKRRPATIGTFLSLLGLGHALPPPTKKGIDFGFAVAAALGVVISAAFTLPAEDSRLTRAMLDRQPLPACAKMLPKLAEEICAKYGAGHPNCQQALSFLVAREECPNRAKQLQACLEKP